MKKIIGIAAVAAMVATSAFADITFGSWNRGIWYTAANEYNGSDNEVVTSMGQSWGGDSPRVGLSVHGSSDNAGFDLDYYGNGASTGVGDNVRLWIKPIQQFKLMMGKFDDNPLRGNACFGLWDWKRIGGVSGSEGWTFPGQSATGAQLAFFPIEGLSIYAVLPLSTNTDSNTAITTELGHKAGYYAAYAIKDIGTVKAGVTCKDSAYNKDGTDKVDYAVINAAFDLTAVKNLFVTVGAFIPTADAYTYTKTTTAATEAHYGWVYYENYDGSTYSNATTDMTKAKYSHWEMIAATGASSTSTCSGKETPQINAYAKYTMDKLTVHAIVGTKLNAADGNKTGDDALKGNVGLNIGGGVDYGFDNNIGVFADVRYANGVWMKNNSSDHKDALTLGAGITKGFSNGLIGVAFEGVTNGGNYGIYTSQKNTEDFSWAVPVKVELSF